LQGGQDSNLQPAVLETAALPIEPPPYGDEILRLFGDAFHPGDLLDRMKMGAKKLG
jgi:hypothetical protein